MRIVIHSCNQRLWYVRNFLVPFFHGKADVKVWNDSKGRGCLQSFVDSAKYLGDNPSGMTWHLQDDVLPDRKFFDTVKGLPDDEIIMNGFVTTNFDPVNYQYVGLQPVKNYWYSFPCFCCPDSYMGEFADWFNDVRSAGKYVKKIQARRYADFFFWQFVKERKNDRPVYNIVPNLVQHVDYLIGGSTVNHPNNKPINRAYYWTDEASEEALKQVLSKDR